MADMKVGDMTLELDEDGFRAAGAGQSKKTRLGMVGRAAERKTLADALTALKDQQKGGIVLIEGEAGIGKSRLVADMLEHADASSVSHFIATADAVERSTAYHAWRAVFHHVFHLDAVADDRAARREHVLGYIDKHAPALKDRAPLLNVVLSLDVPDTELTSAITGEVRAENMRELLVGLLATARDSLLILEDAHWLDSASWALALAVSRRLPSTLLVIATRPISEPVPAEYRSLRSAPGTVKIELTGMTPDESLDLVKLRLGVSALPDAVERLVRDKAQGNPFFSEELAYALRDSGLLIVNGGQCHLSTEAGDLNGLTFPDTVQGVVRSRIDRLPPAQQLTLKVASVIGRIFGYTALREIHPVDADKMNLATYLSDLEHLEMTPKETPGPELSYIFKHVITQEVAYSLMAFAQRRQLHRVVAEWYERTYKDDLSPYFPFLAYHWKRVLESGEKDARAFEKALEFLEKAGEQALDRYANQETIGFFSDVLKMSQEAEKAGLPNLASPSRLLRWHRRIAMGYLGLSQYEMSLNHGHEALSMLGFPVPTAAPEILAVLEEPDREKLAAVLWPGELRARMAREPQLAMESAGIYDQLLEVYFHSRGPLFMTEAIVRAINLIESAGPSPVLARSYAGMAMAMALAPMHDASKFFIARALAVTEQVNQPAVSAYVWPVCGFCRLGMAQLDEAKILAEKAVDVATKLGNSRSRDQGFEIIAAVLLHRGRFDDSIELAAKAVELARNRQDNGYELFALILHASALLSKGTDDHIAQVLSLMERAESLLGPFQPIDLPVAVRGLKALALHLAGKKDLAHELLKKIDPDNIVLISSEALKGLPHLVEAHLAWLDDEDEPQSDDLELAGKLCTALERGTKTFPLMEPDRLRHLGTYARLTGDMEQAANLLTESLKAALQLRLPHEEGLAAQELCACHDEGSEAHKKFHEIAEHRFREVGAQYHLKNLPDRLKKLELARQRSLARVTLNKKTS